MGFFVVGLILLLAALPAPAAEQASPPPEGAVPGEDAGVAAVALSLRDVLTAALENNLDITVRRYDPLRSETFVTVQGAAFDPLLTGSASSSEDERRGISSFFGPFTSQDKIHFYSASFEDPLVTGGRYSVGVSSSDTFNTNSFAGTSTGYNTSWQITVTQPLLRNLGPDVNRWQILVARNDLGASEEQFRQTVLDTLSSAEKAYWDLNFSIMDLRTKRGSLQLAKDFLEQNRIKVRVGTLAPIEITQAEAGVADREEGVIIAENAVRTAEDTLRRIINVPRDSPVWSQPINPSDTLPLTEVTAVMDEAVSAAEENRPDLKQARLSVKSRETELGFRRNQKRWGLDLEGNYGLLGFDAAGYSNSFRDLRDRNQTSWTVTLNLSVPIGNRLAQAGFLNAEHALNQSRYDLQRLEQVARVEVRNAVRTVETDLKRVKAAQVNVRLQREKLAAEQKKFENGMSTSFQVLQFQTDLATAESRENQAIVDYNKSLAELERVKGTLLEARQMVMPGTAGERDEPGSAGAGSGRSAALQSLRKQDGGFLPWSAAARTSSESIARVPLPTSFPFDGRRIIGRSPAIPGGS
jgi:outer membrane protein TolC